MTSGTGMEVAAAAVVKLLRIRYFWGEKYESSVTELPGTCITAAAIDDISLSLSPPLRRVQHFSIEKVMPCKIDTKNHIQILLTIACSFHWFPIVILPRAHSLGKKVKIISVGFGVQKQGFSYCFFYF